MPGRPRPAISRFIVMAMLQAARARRLGLPRESAYSWGLNRAIFFAAAKRGFRGGGGKGGAGPGPDRGSGAGTHPAGPLREEYRLGDEAAFRDASQPKLCFIIGDEPQTEKEFEGQIEARFGGERKFAEAWKEAEKIVGEADPDHLRSGRGFYEHVYKPRRDELAARWSELVARA